MKKTEFPNLWLKTIIVINLIAIIFMLTCVWDSVTWFYATAEKAKLFFWFQHNMIDYYDYGMIVNIAAMIVNVVSAMILLKRKKIGFWLYLISNVVIVAVMAFYAYLGGITSAVVLTMIGALVSPIILYVIFQIKTDNINVYSQLN